MIVFIFSGENERTQRPGSGGKRQLPRQPLTLQAPSKQPIATSTQGYALGGVAKQVSIIIIIIIIIITIITITIIIITITTVELP